MVAMADMAHTIIGDLGVALHTNTTPSREEWDAWMEDVRKVPAAQLRVLAITDGGGPSAVQRNAFVKYLSGAQARIAVLSDALVVRGIVTALSWFTDRIQIFSPDRFSDATAHLDLSRAQCDLVKERLEVLARSLSNPVRAMRGI